MLAALASHMSTVITICVKRRTLPDGSHAFDVCIGGLVLAAHSESDACRLAEDLRDTIYQHTTHLTEVTYAY
jgi:hypothetical protein